jgi:hypothetical protein
MAGTWFVPAKKVAERARFELALPFGKHTLQACALGQTTLPLRDQKDLFAFSAGDYITNYRISTARLG